MNSESYFEIDVDEDIETQVRVCKTFVFTVGEILDKMSEEQSAELLHSLIGPEIDDLYRAVHTGSKTEIDRQFEKIYDALDEHPPHVFKDAA